VTFHQSGNGILTNSSSSVVGGANATMTFASATDFLGINMLFQGMTVDVWNSAGTTKRAPATAAPIEILALDQDSKTVTLNQDVTGLTAGDIITFQGLDTYGPASLLTGQSGYPGSVGAASAGIGGDSWRHGFKYFTDPTNSRYFYSRQLSAIPELIPSRVNASGPLQWEHVLRVNAKIRQKRPNKELWRELTGIAHDAQRASVFLMGMGISQTLVNGPEYGVSKDLIPSNQGAKDEFNYGGVPHLISTRQSRDVIDYLNFGKIGRAEAFETGPFSIEGRNYFEGRNSSGNLMTYMDWGLVSAYDNVCFDSGCFGRIDTLDLPTTNWDA
jgi:hypothetical protein